MRPGDLSLVLKKQAKCPDKHPEPTAIEVANYVLAFLLKHGQPMDGWRARRLHADRALHKG
jgi:hypothetical protein